MLMLTCCGGVALLVGLHHAGAKSQNAECPGCGHLFHIDYSGRVMREQWITCPNCGRRMPESVFERGR
jgi:hypothetical protein